MLAPACLPGIVLGQRSIPLCSSLSYDQAVHCVGQKIQQLILSGMANRANYELQDDQTAVTEPQRQRIRYLRNKTRTDAEEQELIKMAKFKEICEKRRTDMVVTKITKASAEQHAAAVHAVNAHTTMQLQQEIGSLRNALCELPQIAMGSVASS